MPLYLINDGDMEKLIESNVADEPIEDGSHELTYIETFRFSRPFGEEDWIGPHSPRPLLDQIFKDHDIQPDFQDTVDEMKMEDDDSHLVDNALEEEARAEQSVNTRLNNFED